MIANRRVFLRTGANGVVGMLLFSTSMSQTADAQPQESGLDDLVAERFEALRRLVQEDIIDPQGGQPSGGEEIQLLTLIEDARVGFIDRDIGAVVQNLTVLVAAIFAGSFANKVVPVVLSQFQFVVGVLEDAIVRSLSLPPETITFGQYRSNRANTDQIIMGPFLGGVCPSSLGVSRGGGGSRSGVGAESASEIENFNLVACISVYKPLPG